MKTLSFREVSELLKVTQAVAELTFNHICLTARWSSRKNRRGDYMEAELVEGPPAPSPGEDGWRVGGVWSGIVRCGNGLRVSPGSSQATQPLLRAPSTYHTLRRGAKDLSTLKHSKRGSRLGGSPFLPNLAWHIRPIPLTPVLPEGPGGSATCIVTNPNRLQGPSVRVGTWEGVR